MQAKHTTVNRSVIILVVLAVAAAGAFMLSPIARNPFALDAAVIREDCHKEYAAKAQELMDVYMESEEEFDELDYQTSVTFFEDCQRTRGLSADKVQTYEDYSLSKVMAEGMTAQ